MYDLQSITPSVNLMYRRTTRGPEVKPWKKNDENIQSQIL